MLRASRGARHGHCTQPGGRRVVGGGAAPTRGRAGASKLRGAAAGCWRAPTHADRGVCRQRGGVLAARVCNTRQQQQPRPGGRHRRASQGSASQGSASQGSTAKQQTGKPGQAATPRRPGGLIAADGLAQDARPSPVVGAASSRDARCADHARGQTEAGGPWDDQQASRSPEHQITSRRPDQKILEVLFMLSRYWVSTPDSRDSAMRPVRAVSRMPGGRGGDPGI